MEATNPSSSSYAWKSVLRGREVIKRGAIWRIGDGKSAAIWGERWLPNKHAPKVLSPCVADLAEAKVSSFIDQENRSWKVEFIDSILLSFEADMVKKNPPQPHGPARSTLLALQSQWRIFSEIWK